MFCTNVFQVQETSSSTTKRAAAAKATTTKKNMKATKPGQKTTTPKKVAKPAKATTTKKPSKTTAKIEKPAVTRATKAPQKTTKKTTTTKKPTPSLSRQQFQKQAETAMRNRNINAFCTLIGTYNIYMDSITCPFFRIVLTGLYLPLLFFPIPAGYCCLQNSCPLIRTYILQEEKNTFFTFTHFLYTHTHDYTHITHYINIM